MNYNRKDLFLMIIKRVRVNVLPAKTEPKKSYMTKSGKYKVGIDIPPDLWMILKLYCLETNISNSVVIENACRMYLGMELLDDIPAYFPKSIPKYNKHSSSAYKHLSYYLTPELDAALELQMEKQGITKSALVTDALEAFWEFI